MRRLGLAPGRPRDRVDEPLPHPNPDAAERVDEVGEATQVDERVVVDPDPEQARDGLLERGRAGIGAAREELGLRLREAVERVQRLAEALQLPAERNLREVARNPERRRAAGAVLRRDQDDRVGARAPVARPLVGAEQQDRRPRPRGRRRSAGLGDEVGGALERPRLARAEPLGEPEPPGVARDPARQRRRRREEEAARRQHVARLLVREDLLEHAVAAHGHVAGGDVRRRDEDGERGEPDGSAAPPHVGDGEEPEGEQREVGCEHAGDEPPIDLGQRGGGGEREQPQHQCRGDAEQDEPAPPCADVELARAGSTAESRPATSRLVVPAGIGQVYERPATYEEIVRDRWSRRLRR